MHQIQLQTFLLIYLASELNAIPVNDLQGCKDTDSYPLGQENCFLPLSREPCDDGQWTVVTADNRLKCENIPCKNEEAIFNETCINMFDSKACNNFGERLYIDKYGKGVCDCDDGWLRGDDGACYQEFTRGFCEENSILRIKPVKSICKTNCGVQGKGENFIFLDRFRKLKQLALRQYFVSQPTNQLQCEDNPCGDPRMSLPHL